jgi:hypothetical protein
MFAELQRKDSPPIRLPISARFFMTALPLARSEMGKASIPPGQTARWIRNGEDVLAFLTGS